MLQPARRGQKAARRLLRVKARFNRPTGHPDLILAQRQSLARRNAHLPLNQIKPGDRFGDRMLNLQPCVHLHEPKPISPQPCAGIGDEFDGARSDIGHGVRGFHGGGAEDLAGLLVEAGRGGLLDHLLMAALQRAVALEQMNDMAVRITEDLNLEVTWGLDIFFEQHAVIAKGGYGFALTRFQSILERRDIVDFSHTLAATALMRTG